MDRKILVNYVLISGVVLGITLSMIEFVSLYLGMLFKEIMTNIFSIIIFISLFLAVRKYREQVLNGQISFLDAFLVSLFICIFAGIIWSVYRYIQYSLKPGIVYEIIRMNEEVLKQNVSVPENKELLIKLNKMITTPATLAFINTFIVSMLLGGSILSLFLALILKTKSKLISNT